MEEWYIYRPDSLRALDDPQVIKALSRYTKILKDRIPAKFQVVKRFEVDFDKDLDLNSLKEIHDKYFSDFLKLLKRVDEGEVGLEELSADKSLLDLKIEIAEKMIENCIFCERRCKVNRKEELGFCRIGYHPRISSHFVHLGEEPWITPSYTVFFAGCNLKCVFCQNWDISQFPNNGKYIEPKDLARILDNYRKLGVRNVNWVGGDPTPNTHYILKVLKEVKENIPVVWNSNAYESEELHRYVLSGIIDVYLFDFKYYNESCAIKYSFAPKYFEIASRNHKIAFEFGELSIRHLILPNHIDCCTKPILEWISRNFGKKVIVNVMTQYRPEYIAYKFPEINRRLKDEEIREVCEYAFNLDLNFKLQA